MKTQWLGKFGFGIAAAALLVGVGCGGGGGGGSGPSGTSSGDATGTGGSTSQSCQSNAIVTDYSVCIEHKRFYYCANDDASGACAQGDCSKCTEDECQEPC